MATEIKVPALGESVTEATVSKWFKNPGDSVQVDESLCELETDKVTVEVPSPVSGVLTSVNVAQGADVEVGALLGVIEEGAVGKASASAPASASTLSAPAAVSSK